MKTNEEGGRMPPEIKAAMAISREIWDANLRLSRKNLVASERQNLEGKVDELRAEWLSIMDAYEYEREGCQACFGTGWQLYETRHPMKGFEEMQVTKTAPCECELGRQFDVSYNAALTGRRRQAERSRPKPRSRGASDIEF